MAYNLMFCNPERKHTTNISFIQGGIFKVYPKKDLVALKAASKLLFGSKYSVDERNYRSNYVGTDIFVERNHENGSLFIEPGVYLCFMEEGDQKVIRKRGGLATR